MRFPANSPEATWGSGEIIRNVSPLPKRPAILSAFLVTSWWIASQYSGKLAATSRWPPRFGVSVFWLLSIWFRRADSKAVNRSLWFRSCESPLVTRSQSVAKQKYSNLIYTAEPSQRTYQCNRETTARRDTEGISSMWRSLGCTACHPQCGFHTFWLQ